MADYGDLLASTQALERRRKLLEAMQAQSQTPIQANNPLDRIIQAFTKVGGAYLGGQQEQQLTRDTSAQQSAYSDALKQQLAEYMAQSQGQAGQFTLPADQAGPQVPAVQGDPRAAIVNAMVSRFPEMQKLGAVGMEGLIKGHGERKPLVVNNKVLDDNLNVVKDLSDPAERWTEPFQRGGDWYQRNVATGKEFKLDNAPKTSVTTNVGGATVINEGQKKGVEELFKLDAKTVDSLGEKARSAVSAISSLDQLNKLTDAGTFSGPSSKPAIWLGQLADSAGIPFDQSKLTNSQAFQSVATDAWQRIVSQYGGNRGVTAQEADAIKAITPQLANSPDARRKMVEILKGVAQRSVDDYKRANASFRQSIVAEDPRVFTEGGAVMLPSDVGVPSVPGAGQKKPVVKGW